MRSILVRVFAVFFIVPAWLILPGVAPARGAGVDAPRAVSYGTAAGTWDSAEVGLLRINQIGASVSGSYATGVFSGGLSGHTITFSMWEEATSYTSADPEDRGSGSMIINDDWTALSGSWKADQGNASGTFNATRVAGAPNYTTGTDIGDIGDMDSSALPTQDDSILSIFNDSAVGTPFSSYFNYDIYLDQWYDVNGYLIGDAYTFASWLHGFGYVGDSLHGWTNHGVPITEYTGLYNEYFSALGCTQCSTSPNTAITPGGGLLYSQDFRLHNQDSSYLNYDPYEGKWTDTGSGAANWSPFRYDFTDWMQNLGYHYDSFSAWWNPDRAYADAQGQFPDMAMMFDTYCLTNGARPLGSNMWFSPSGYHLINPYTHPENQTPAGTQSQQSQAPLPSNQDLSQAAQGAEEALAALSPTDPVMLVAFEIAADLDGFER